MPFIEPEPIPASVYISDPEFKDDITLGDAMSAAFATDNVLGSALMMKGNLPDYKQNPDFNAYEMLTEDEKLDQRFVENALLSDNEGELNALRDQYSMERKNRQLLSDAGAMGFFASLSMAALDPINFIPVGGTSYKTYRTGASILEAGAITAGVASSTTAAQEALLHKTQVERTFTESAVNVTGATVLGMALGVTPAALSKYFTDAEINRLYSEIEDSLNPEAKIAAGQDSVGAARAYNDVVVKGKTARKLLKVLAFDPLSRTLTSKSDVTRQVAAKLAESPVDFEGGITSQAVETLIKTHDGKYAQALEGHLTHYKAMVKRGEKIKRREFNELVAREIRNPGSNIPEVKAAAKEWNEKLYNPMTKNAIEAKLLDEDLDPVTAQGYLNRTWNKDKINGNLDQFVKVVSRWLRDENPESDLDFDDLAREIAQVISSSADGRLPYDYKIGESRAKGSQKAGLKGAFKSRTFLIPDAMVEDFLENDIELLGARYLKTVAPDIELTKAFGDVNMEAEIKAIADSYDGQIREASKTNPKEAIKLKKQRERDIKDVAAMRDRIRGTYGQVDPDNLLVRVGRVSRDLNYLRLMGGVVAASVPDVGRVIMAEGFVRAFGDGLVPLIKNVKSFKIAASEGKAYGIGAEVIYGGRSEIIADVADYTAGGTAFERGVRSMAQGFGQINLMDRWTAGMKQWHLVTMQNRLIPMLKKGQYDKRLSQLGISKDDALAIGEQLKKHSEEIDKCFVANSKKWDNKDLADMWGAALRKESDRVIIMPGQEKPLFMSSEMGKTFFQFKSFMFSATQRVLISGVQGSDAHYLQGVISLIGFGMMSYAFKQWDAGRELSDDPMAWVTEGIDRSGALGSLMEINNTLEKVSNNTLGMRPLLGVSAPASRYASRSVVEAALGPTFGSLLDTSVRVLQAGTDGEWSDSDTRALRRLLPYQNLSILRQGLDKIEENLK